MTTISAKNLLNVLRRVLVILLVSIMMPFNVKADDPTPGQPSNEGIQEAPVWVRYNDDQWDLSFEYLSSWSVSEQIYPEENQREVELFHDLDGRIIVTRAENPENLTPQQWFEQSRDQYNDLVQVIAVTEIQNNQALIIGLPDTCISVPLLQAILGHGGRVYKFTFLGTGSKEMISELKRLLETLAFEGQSALSASPLPDAYFTIPGDPENVTCPTGVTGKSEKSLLEGIEAADTSARICSGAEFYIPTEGTLFSPYACFNSSYCTLYATGKTGEFGYPHSGLDIMGNQLPGVTPVVATGSGAVYSIGDSAIRILFDPPWNKYSAYSTHMATGLKSLGNYKDFRVLKTGDRAIGGDLSHPIGYMGNYDSTYNWGNGNVHLHISYNDSQTDLWSINQTEDPTIFLKAKYLKYYSGWNHRGPIACVDTVGNGGVDVYFLVDLTSSFEDDLPNFKSQAPGIIATLKSKNPDTRFGLGAFEDYPIYPFGSAEDGDTAYHRIVDLTSDSTAIINAINGLSTRYGRDLPESQLTALFQAATGAGQDLSSKGYPNASIPASQGASFRKGAEKMIILWTDAPFHQPGDPGDIAYPGTSEAVAASALLGAGITACVPYPCSSASSISESPQNITAEVENDESGPRTIVMGITSGGGEIKDLQTMARFTGAYAPEEGVDCDEDGIIDVAYGEPLICGISSSGEGIGTAVIALVEAATKPGDFGKVSPANGSMNQSTSLTLSWEKSNGAASYEYCYDTSNDDTCNWISNGAATSVRLTGLSPNTTHYWHVRATRNKTTTYSNGSSNSFWSFTTLKINSTLYMTENQGTLRKIDQKTGSTTIIGELGTNAIVGLSNRPGDPLNIYGVELTGFGGQGPSRLVRINAVTAQVTPLPVFDQSILGIPNPTAYGIAISPTAPNTAVITGVNTENGVHYYLWKVDVTTGAVLGAAIPTTQWVNELAYNLDGSILYGVNIDGQLVTVNSNTGNVTLVGDPGLSPFIEGLAFRPGDGALFAIDGYDQDRLVRLNPANGNLVEIIESLGVAGPYGLAFVSVDGADTTGVFRPSNGLLYLKHSNTTGFADIAINYGLGGDYPVVGDWDGNGTDTIGVYRNGRFLLRNSNTIGFANLNFLFGRAGDLPIAGDWDGDGKDTVGVYRPSTGQFLLRNSNSAGVEDMSFYLGNVGDVGIAGDWNGDGIDTTGVFRPGNGVIFLKNTNKSGFADIALNYGLTGDRPVTGDWNNDGTDTIGILRGNVFYLRNTNTVGYADMIFALGIPGDMPIAGNWDGSVP